MTDRIDSFKGDFSFLSNFWSTPIRYYDEVLRETVTARSVEHAYTSQKSLDPATRRAILSVPTAAASKKLGGSCTLREDWTPETRIFTMCRFLEIKFSDPTLRELLSLTGDAELVERHFLGDLPRRG